MSSKVQEAIGLMAEAEKAVNKTTWLGKKKPDWETARPLYDNAGGALGSFNVALDADHACSATMFKNAKAYDHAVEAFVKSAAANKEEGSLFIAAKQLETAAQLLAQHMKKPQDAAKLYQQASDYFLAHGSPDRAAEMFEKAGKVLEPVDVVGAMEMYKEACSTYETEDKLRAGVDTFTRSIGFAIRSKRLLEAIELSQRLTDIFQKLQNGAYVNKQALSTIVIVLLLGDDVEANKRMSSFSSIPGFLDSEDGHVASDLIEAFQSYDHNLLQASLKRSPIKFLDNEVAKAAMSLRVPGGGSSKRVDNPQTGNDQSFTGGGGGGDASLVGDDDDDEGLC
ncbi:hypothetical protein HK101_009732 [Irineochytrium annulatum]|nr:hypothetical protein HK101_009732 [Irineochytrium annulatum]